MPFRKGSTPRLLQKDVGRSTAWTILQEVLKPSDGLRAQWQWLRNYLTMLLVFFVIFCFRPGSGGLACLAWHCLHMKFVLPLPLAQSAPPATRKRRSRLPGLALLLNKTSSCRFLWCKAHLLRPGSGGGLACLAWHCLNITFVLPLPLVQSFAVKFCVRFGNR